LAFNDLNEKVRGAIRTYNKFRSPEVIAELVETDEHNRTFTILFKGTFCRTCGFYDYFEDFAYDFLDETRFQTTILKVDEDWDTESFKVTYALQE
jgi:superoxide reductase